MGKPGIAMTLFTVYQPAAKDLLGTLKRVRDTGFEYVQWSGMPAISAEEIRAALDEAGLKPIACHCAVEPFEKDFLQEVRFWKTVGVSDVAPGGMMSDCRDSLEGWRRGVKRLDILGAKLRDVGIRLSYHNHDFELKTFPEDPRPKLDILYEECAPDNLYAELDVAWLDVGGADPAEYIRKYPRRCPLIHAKDLKPERKDGQVQFTELGRGVLDWPDILAAACEAGVEWCIYEQDTCEGDPLDSVRISFEFLNKQLR